MRNLLSICSLYITRAARLLRVGPSGSAAEDDGAAGGRVGASGAAATFLSMQVRGRSVLLG
jgi:hypothetical protein